MGIRPAVTTAAVALLLTPVVLFGALLWVPVALALLAALPILGAAGLSALPWVARVTRLAATGLPGLPPVIVHSCATGSRTRRGRARQRRVVAG